MKKQVFKILAKVNKAILPSYTTKTGLEQSHEISNGNFWLAFIRN